MKISKPFISFSLVFLLFSCSTEETDKNDIITIVTPVDNDLVETELAVDSSQIIQDSSITESSAIPVDTKVKEVGNIEIEPTVDEEIGIVIETALINPEDEIEVINIVEQAVIDKPSHFNWDYLLHLHVSSKGDVDYKSFKKDSEPLGKYLKLLSDFPPKNNWSKNEKLAYWINLYNASTVKLILDNYPISSITEINNGKPWDLKFIKSGNNIYSLNQIENDIIRPRFKEPRIHMAVNCAAISCPKIMNKAFVAEKLSSQLTKQAKAFVQNELKNKLTKSSVKISKIFEWYEDDFEADGGIIAFLKKYSDQEINENASISYLDYNWKLNE